jgi:hypothetical protein
VCQIGTRDDLPIAVLALHSRWFLQIVSQVSATFYELMGDVVSEIEQLARNSTSDCGAARIRRR